MRDPLLQIDRQTDRCIDTDSVTFILSLNKQSKYYQKILLRNILTAKAFPRFQCTCDLCSALRTRRLVCSSTLASFSSFSVITPRSRNTSCSFSFRASDRVLFSAQNKKINKKDISINFESAQGETNREKCQRVKGLNNCMFPPRGHC